MAATESKEEGNNDDPSVFAARDRHPLAGQTIVMPSASTSPQRASLHAMAAPHPPPGLTNSRAKVYYSPKLIYLKVSVLTAQDLIDAEKDQPLVATIAKIQMGNQIQWTTPQGGTPNPAWNEEFMFVATEPFEDPLVVTVEEKDDPIGRVIIPVNSSLVPRNDLPRSVPSKWFSLSRGKDAATSFKFAGMINMKVSLETAYHVLDESMHYHGHVRLMSDLQPAAKELRKSAIGILEVGILGATGLGPNKKPYCVAKYGGKWVRTWTLMATAAPQWHEQYTWEVFDLCTVITVAVFDNATLHQDHGHGDAKDQRIGKVRVLLASLQTDRLNTHYYPLMALTPTGLNKTGELHLAVRFTCTAWANMLTQYGRPLFPNLHPISELQLDYVRFHAMQTVATLLSRAEPPVRMEVVEYMFDINSHMFSLRRSKANFLRLTSLLSGVPAVAKFLDGICQWKNPWATMLAHMMFLYIVRYPELVLPMVFLCMIMIGAWNYRQRPQTPPYIDPVLSQAEDLGTLPPPNTDSMLDSLLWYADQALPDELDEEFDTFPTSRSDDIVRMRYDRLRSIAGKVQTVVGDLAMKGERAQSLVKWHDPRMTPVFIALSLVMAVILYLTPFRVVATVTGLHFLMPPRLRSRNNMLYNLYSRLPSMDDMML